ATEHDDETMLADRLDKNLRIGHSDLLKLLAHRDTALGRRPARPAVGDQALCIDRAEIAADRHILRADLEVDSERFENSPADAIFERVVAEETEMPRAAPRRDARQHGNTQAAYPFTHTGVQVWRPRRFELGLAPWLHRQTAQAV